MVDPVGGINPFEKYALELGSFPPTLGMNIKSIFETTHQIMVDSFLSPPDYGSLWPDTATEKRHVHRTFELMIGKKNCFKEHLLHRCIYMQAFSDI